jgi:hypothetical protein
METTEGLPIVALDDLDAIEAMLERADRLMYAADNFSDRSEFAKAKEAFDRVSERQRRLLGYYQATAPVLFEGLRPRIVEGYPFLDTVREHVAASLDVGWDVDRSIRKTWAQDDEDDGA